MGVGVCRFLIVSCAMNEWIDGSSRKQRRQVYYISETERLPVIDSLSLMFTLQLHHLILSPCLGSKKHFLFHLFVLTPFFSLSLNAGSFVVLCLVYEEDCICHDCLACRLVVQAGFQSRIDCVRVTA